MQAVDNEVLGSVARSLAADRSCWLCTVVKTYGSSPRPVGSLMTCDESGTVVGSLSGGCVEDDLLEQLQAGKLPADRPQLMKYGLDPEDTERLGLPCGGHLYVVVEPLQPTAENQARYRHIADRLAARESVQRTVDSRTGEVTVADLEKYEPLVLEEHDDDHFGLSHCYGPRFQLFLIGAGMVSHYIAQMAQALDYQVTVCDPREQLLADWQVEGTTNLCMMPDDGVREYAQDPLTAIVALTHDPRIDDMGLMEALQTSAFYVGAMGSTRTSASRRERLKLLDLTTEEIDRLHAPVGLPIGSKTPPEIAIAILAELTAVRKQKEAEVRAYLAAAAVPVAAAVA